MQKSRVANSRQPNLEDKIVNSNDNNQYGNSVSLSSQQNKSIEDVISTRISDSFQNNFPNSIKIYNDLVLPTKETALKELRIAAETAPTG